MRSGANVEDDRFLNPWNVDVHTLNIQLSRNDCEKKKERKKKVRIPIE